jgi:hypothetical protein
LADFEYQFVIHFAITTSNNLSSIQHLVITLCGFVVAEQTGFADNVAEKNPLEARMLLIATHSLFLRDLIKIYSRFGLHSMVVMFFIACVVCCCIVNLISPTVAIIFFLGGRTN